MSCARFHDGIQIAISFGMVLAGHHFQFPLSLFAAWAITLSLYSGRWFAETALSYLIVPTADRNLQLAFGILAAFQAVFVLLQANTLRQTLVRP